MPKQYVVCGRLVPRLGTRHISLLLVALALFSIFSLLFTLPTSFLPASASRLQEAAKFSVPQSFKSPWVDKLNPFKQPAHQPPRQKNDTDGESWWYADWKWLTMPFSSSVTLDENRAVLPVLKLRTPIYCYYDNTVDDKDHASRDAESDLLLTWRRAWWAQGFKPIILSPAEAMNNPMYEEVQKLEGLKASLRTDMMRWLAWENMGGGLLADRLLFPMGGHNDPLLTYLRRGEFPKLTRWKTLDDGIYAGPKAEVRAAIKLVIAAAPGIKDAKDFLEAVQSDSKTADPFAVDGTSHSLAYYSPQKIKSSYSKVDEAIKSSKAAGLKSLNQLITSHLHITWQNTFSDGIAVVKPLPEHTTHLIAPALDLASRLAHCPESPLPDSCPPNRPDCTPCDDSKPMKITTPSSYSNSTTLYTLGTVPHPYTLATLTSRRKILDIPWIRRKSPRDAWITELTSSLFPDQPLISSGPRILRFKEAVASDRAADRSLWLPAEQSHVDLPESDLPWHFGFALPDRATYADDTSQSPEKKKEEEEGEEEEEEIIRLAQEVVLAETSTLQKLLSGKSWGRKKSKSTSDKKNELPPKELAALRDAVEAWNLADTEAWRFARAYLARETVERRKWEEEEAKFAGGMGSERRSSDHSHHDRGLGGG
jgi:hypothetical protein